MPKQTKRQASWVLRAWFFRFSIFAAPIEAVTPQAPELRVKEIAKGLQGRGVKAKSGKCRPNRAYEMAFLAAKPWKV